MTKHRAGELIRRAGQRVGRVVRIFEPDVAGMVEVLYLTPADEPETAYFYPDSDTPCLAVGW